MRIRPKFYLRYTFVISSIIAAVVINWVALIFGMEFTAIYIFVLTSILAVYLTYSAMQIIYVKDDIKKDVYKYITEQKYPKEQKDIKKRNPWFDIDNLYKAMSKNIKSGNFIEFTENLELAELLLPIEIRNWDCYFDTRDVDDDGYMNLSGTRIEKFAENLEALIDGVIDADNKRIAVEIMELYYNALYYANMKNICIDSECYSVIINLFKVIDFDYLQNIKIKPVCIYSQFLNEQFLNHNKRYKLYLNDIIVHGFAFVKEQEWQEQERLNKIAYEEYLESEDYVEPDLSEYPKDDDGSLPMDGEEFSNEDWEREESSYMADANLLCSFFINHYKQVYYGKYKDTINRSVYGVIVRHAENAPCEIYSDYCRLFLFYSCCFELPVKEALDTLVSDKDNENLSSRMDMKLSNSVFYSELNKERRPLTKNIYICMYLYRWKDTLSGDDKWYIFADEELAKFYINYYKNFISKTDSFNETFCGYISLHIILSALYFETLHVFVNSAN
jgi:hypothetical protein